MEAIQKLICMEKKRILFMHQVSSIGGASYCLLNILKSIDRSRFEPIVALKSEGPLCLEIKKIGIKVVLFPEMNIIPYNKSIFRIKSIQSYLGILLSIPRYLKLLRANNINVVYLNNMMLYPYLKFSKKIGMQTVIHVREHWPVGQHVLQLKCAKKYVYKYADQVIAINNYSANIFKDVPVTIVYDWVNMDDRYEPFPFSEFFGADDSNLKVYLYTGGMLSIKGTVQVIDAFTQTITDSNARLLIVGLDPTMNSTGIKGRIKRFLSRIGYDTYEYAVKNRINKDQRIRCIPATYNLSHIMQQSYCNLSFFTIPHANLALAECAIMGTPSIAARTDESIEYSFNEKFAILYELGNMEAFVNSIESFDSRYDDLKNNLTKFSNNIKYLFSSERNEAILNNVLARLF